MMKNKWIGLLLVLAVVAAAGLNASTALAQNYVHYVVASGDQLGKIAYRYCTNWKDIYKINRDTIGKNPNLIRPGMALTVPAQCDRGGSSVVVPPPASGVFDSGPITHATGIYNDPYYTIAWGDVLSSIGQRFGISWERIAKDNNIKNTVINTGKTLIISSSGGKHPSSQAPERINFGRGATVDSRAGVINQGASKSYLLGVRDGQVLQVVTASHGEPLHIAITNNKGGLLTLNGDNGKINNNAWVNIPVTGDYYVTVSPLTLPESPSMPFDISFVIP